MNEEHISLEDLILYLERLNLCYIRPQIDYLKFTGYSESKCYEYLSWLVENVE